MFTELLLSTILSTSFSVRTPNDDTKPLDYEYMVKAEKTDGNFTWSFKKDWERELGEKYEDNVWKFNQKSRILYGGIDYVNKESKDIKYLTYNIGLNKSIDMDNTKFLSEDATTINKKLATGLLKNNTTFKIGLSISDLSIYDDDWNYLKYYETDQKYDVLLNVAVDTKLKWKTIDYSAKISSKNGLYNNNHIFTVDSEIKKWFGKFNIFGSYKQEYFNNKNDSKFKVGVGIQL